MRRWLVALAFLSYAVPARAAEVERWAILVGNNAGQGAEALLRYAENDAARMSDVLRDLGGFATDHMVVLRGEDSETARRALIGMNERIRASGAPSMLFVYYSGHADGSALHLGRTQLPLAEVESLVRGSPAGFRLLVVDACRSGALTRVKGGRPVEPFSIALDQRLPGEGAVFLTSSSVNEDSQESDALGGSFFTHYLVSGLRGAADEDGDGRVTLAEAYKHAYSATLRATSGTLAGAQHPAFRYDLRGDGDVVLTAPLIDATRGRDRGVLEFPAGTSFLVLAGSADGAVVGEVGAEDARRALAVRPGRYFVRGRAPRHLLEGDVEVAAGGLVVIAESALRRVEYARLVRKGGGPSQTVVVEAGFLVRSALLGGQDACLGAGAGVALERRDVTLRARLDACRSGYVAAPLAASVDQLALELGVAHLWDIGRFAVGLEAFGGAAYLRESYTTRGRAPTRSTAAGLLGAGGIVRYDLAGGFGVGADIAAETWIFRRLDGTDEKLGASLAVSTLAVLVKAF